MSVFVLLTVALAACGQNVYKVEKERGIDLIQAEKDDEALIAFERAREVKETSEIEAWIIEVERFQQWNRYIDEAELSAFEIALEKSVVPTAFDSADAAIWERRVSAFRETLRELLVRGTPFQEGVADMERALRAYEYETVVTIAGELEAMNEPQLWAKYGEQVEEWKRRANEALTKVNEQKQREDVARVEEQSAVRDEVAKKEKESPKEQTPSAPPAKTHPVESVPMPPIEQRPPDEPLNECDNCSQYDVADALIQRMNYPRPLVIGTITENNVGDITVYLYEEESGATFEIGSYAYDRNVDQFYDARRWQEEMEVEYVY